MNQKPENSELYKYVNALFEIKSDYVKEHTSLPFETLNEVGIYLFELKKDQEKAKQAIYPKYDLMKVLYAANCLPCSSSSIDKETLLISVHKYLFEYLVIFSSKLQRYEYAAKDEHLENYNIILSENPVKVIKK
jgi:hypothetical protein